MHPSIHPPIYPPMNPCILFPSFLSSINLSIHKSSHLSTHPLSYLPIHPSTIHHPSILSSIHLPTLPHTIYSSSYPSIYTNLSHLSTYPICACMHPPCVHPPVYPIRIYWCLLQAQHSAVYTKKGDLTQSMRLENAALKLCCLSLKFNQTVSGMWVTCNVGSEIECE